MKPKYPIVWIIFVLCFSLFTLIYFSYYSYTNSYQKDIIIALDHGENAKVKISDEYFQVKIILYKLINSENIKSLHDDPKKITDFIKSELKKENIIFDYVVGYKDLKLNEGELKNNRIIKTQLVKDHNNNYLKLHVIINNYEYYILLYLNDTFPKFFKDYYDWFNLGLLAKINNKIVFLDKSSEDLTKSDNSLIKIFKIKNIHSLKTPLYIGVYKNNDYFQNQKIRLLYFIITVGLLIIFLSIFAAYKLFYVEMAKIKAHKKIKYLAYHEEEFDIFNIIYIEKKFPNMISKYILQNKSSKAYLLTISLQNFSSIVNSYGHKAGHTILSILINQIREYNKSQFSEASEQSILFKYEKNKLGVLLLVDNIDIRLYISNIKNLCNSPVKISNQYVFFDLNFGISSYPDDSKDISELLIKSDIALSDSYSLGVGGYKFYNIQMQEYIKNNLALEHYLKEAITEEKFELLFQPQINISDNSLYGCEALVRLKDSSGKFISPDIFIQVLEKTKMIVPVGNWILKKSCESAKVILDNDIDFERISVNLSLVQIEDESFMKDLKETVQKSNLPFNKLSLEITENVIGRDHKNIANKISELNELGIKVAIDDFGTGYCSLSYLDRYKLDHLKIPKPFVDKIASQESSKQMFIKMAEIGRANKLNIIVEGVENKEQLDIIKSIDNDFIIQGYYFSKPINLNDFIKFAKDVRT